MTERYQQFLGSKPGLLVELVDGTTSPYRVRTEDGFEFFVSADDFRTYYRKEEEPTPPRWRHLITDQENGMVDSGKMAQVMEVVHRYVGSFQNFDKARLFVREAFTVIAADPESSAAKLKKWADESGWNPGSLSEKDMEPLLSVSEDIRSLLVSTSCAVIPFLDVGAAGGNGEGALEGATLHEAAVARSKPASGEARKSAVRSRRTGMKNVEMAVDGDTLTLTIDLSKEFGPSKSGKTTIIASTEGNKSVPGRNERVGLNVYKQEGKKPGAQRRKSFKNVEMDVAGDVLTLTVDLSKEFGPSKSGKTMMIASTEGNRPVYGRAERIGLNVYRKLE